MISLNLPKQRIIIHEATPWKRAIAFIIDFIFINFLFAPTFNKFLVDETWTLKTILQQEIVLPEGFFLAIIFMSIIMILYFALFEYYLGYTPGMHLFGLIIGGERTISKTIIRNLYIIPFFPFTILWVIEPYFLFTKKERLLEKWTKTKTIEIMKV